MFSSRSSYLQRLNVVLNHCLKSITYEPIACFATKPSITVSQTNALVDQKVCITVSGLPKGQKVTLQTYVKDADKRFGSCGFYIADDEGKVDTFKDECQGGTFDGLEPMGLFWSMRSPPKSKPRRILKLDVANPYEVKIALHSGFRDFNELPWTDNFSSLASCKFYQWFMAPDVRCIPVRENGLIGTLFLPPGEGPFPAVIDIFGMTSLYPGHRSSLLASNGIASFVIAYVGHEGLAHSAEDLDFTYFLRAYDWLMKHPNVNPDAMGGIGSCIGGAYATIIAWKRPSMKCFVGLNSAIRPMGPHQVIEGEVLDETLSKWRYDLAEESDGAFSFRSISRIEDNLQPLPYWKHGIKVLHIQGTDDQSVNPDVLIHGHANLPEEFRNNFEFITYHGAGHIIEPPYMPLCRQSYNSIFNMTLLWGGQPKLHAHAQMDSWPKVVAFLKKHLIQTSVNGPVSSQSL